MKRRRLLIAGLVAVAAGVCAVSWWNEAWLTVAYRFDRREFIYQGAPRVILDYEKRWKLPAKVAANYLAWIALTSDDPEAQQAGLAGFERLGIHGHHNLSRFLVERPDDPLSEEVLAALERMQSRLDWW